MQMQMKTCVECGRSFAPTRADQMFCGPLCADRLKKRRMRLSRQALGLCPQCGSPLRERPFRKGPGKAKGNKITYCPACREKFRRYYERRKAGQG